MTTKTKTKTKTIILSTLLFLSILFIPNVSKSAILVPTVNITINASVPEQEQNIHFDIKEAFYEYDETIDDFILTWRDYQQVDLQTENKTASITLSPNFNGYRIIQNKISGLKIEPVICISDFVPENILDDRRDIFIQIKNGIEIYPAAAHENIVCEFINTTISDKTPILIVPGILGTEM